MKKIISVIEKKFNSLTYLDSCVTVRASHEVRIENCKRVLECDDILVKIKTTDCDIIVWGENLEMECYNEDIISVYGKITSIEFEAKKNDR